MSLLPTYEQATNSPGPMVPVPHAPSATQTCAETTSPGPGTPFSREILDSFEWVVTRKTLIVHCASPVFDIYEDMSQDLLEMLNRERWRFNNQWDDGPFDVVVDRSTYQFYKNKLLDQYVEKFH